MAEIVNYLQMARETLAKQTSEMSDAQRAALTIKAAAAVHDHWVRNHTDEFFDATRMRYRYRLLPLELIGWTDTQACLDELMAVSNDFDRSLSREALKGAYQDAVIAFRHEHGMASRRGVINYLMRDLSEYEVVGSEVTKHLYHDYHSAEEMANQVIEQLRELVMFVI